jgi:hypothetical protein
MSDRIDFYFYRDLQLLSSTINVIEHSIKEEHNSTMSLQ